MLEVLFWISAKKIVVAFALLGATVVTIAPKISKWAEPKEDSEFYLHKCFDLPAFRKVAKKDSWNL